MKGSVFVLLGCFALFFAAPSHSYSITEDDLLANRQDTQSGSRSTDAVESAETLRMDGGANPGDEAVAGDAQAEKSKIRKRDTRGSARDETDTVQTFLPPIDKSFALGLFKRLANYGGKCFENFFDYIDVHEMPTSFLEEWRPENRFTRADMAKWLEIMKDILSECLTKYVDQLISEHLWTDRVKPNSRPDTFDSVEELLSPLTDIGKSLKKCLEDAIRYLEETSQGPGDTVQRSSESFSDLLTELIQTLSRTDRGPVPSGDTVPTFPADHPVPHYLDSVPVITTYKKRNSLNKPREYRYYSNLPGFIHPQYVYTKDIPNSIAPQFSAFREEALQIPYTPGITSLPEDVKALHTPKLSLLDIVLDKIYSKLNGKMSPAVNMEAAPVEGLRVDASGAPGSYPGNGEGPAMGNLKFTPECVYKMV